MSESLGELQERLSYSFHRDALLLEALTHPSYLQDHPEISSSNQRLEFLGDAVLQLVITDELYRLYPSEREGVLSKRRAALSKGAFLAQLARTLKLDQALRLSLSEDSTGGRTRTAALEDAFEAIIGAVYLDSNFATAQRVVLGCYGDLGKRFAEVEAMENPKGKLQELIQPQHGNNAVRYDVIAVHGEDHARSYEVAVFLNEQQLGTGRGSSKKIAEEAAAQNALRQLQTKPLS